MSYTNITDYFNKNYTYLNSKIVNNWKNGEYDVSRILSTIGISLTDEEKSNLKLVSSVDKEEKESLVKDDKGLLGKIELIDRDKTLNVIESIKCSINGSYTNEISVRVNNRLLFTSGGEKVAAPIMVDDNSKISNSENIKRTKDYDAEIQVVEKRVIPTYGIQDKVIYGYSLSNYKVKPSDYEQNWGFSSLSDYSPVNFGFTLYPHIVYNNLSGSNENRVLKEYKFNEDTEVCELIFLDNSVERYKINKELGEFVVQYKYKDEISRTSKSNGDVSGLMVSHIVNDNTIDTNLTINCNFNFEYTTSANDLQVLNTKDNDYDNKIILNESTSVTSERESSVKTKRGYSYTPAHKFGGQSYFYPTIKNKDTLITTVNYFDLDIKNKSKGKIRTSFSFIGRIDPSEAMIKRPDNSQWLLPINNRYFTITGTSIDFVSFPFLLYEKFIDKDSNFFSFSFFPKIGDYFHSYDADGVELTNYNYNNGYKEPAYFDGSESVLIPTVKSEADNLFYSNAFDLIGSIEHPLHHSIISNGLQVTLISQSSDVKNVEDIDTALSAVVLWTSSTESPVPEV